MAFLARAETNDTWPLLNSFVVLFSAEPPEIPTPHCRH
jgi:hypothetical protein